MNNNIKISKFIRTHMMHISVFMFLFVILTSLLITTHGSLSTTGLKPYVSYESLNTNYEKKKPGSWILDKSVYLKSNNIVELDFKIQTNEKLLNKKNDTIVLIENNNKSNIELEKEFLNNYIWNLQSHIYNGKLAIATYNENYNIINNFSDNTDLLYDNIINLNNIESDKLYYENALKAIDEILSSYVIDDDTILNAVILIQNLSEGNSINENIMYKELKQKYPYLNITTIYSNETISDSVKNISDKQIIYSDNLYIDFVQTLVNESYKVFEINSYLSDYFDLNTLEIETSNGLMTLEYDNNKPYIKWVLNDKLLSGNSESAKVYVRLKNNIDDKVLPVYTNTKIITKINGVSDEIIETPLTPVLFLE